MISDTDDELPLRVSTMLLSYEMLVLLLKSFPYVEEIGKIVLTSVLGWTLIDVTDALLISAGLIASWLSLRP